MTGMDVHGTHVAGTIMGEKYGIAKESNSDCCEGARRQWNQFN